MAYRRRRQFSLPDHRHRHAPNNVDHLAFKYMEMCKVDSSTDSDSEISPRWSDTSTMGCVSSTPESGTIRRTLPLTHKSAGRHGCYSLFLDPYDGSSEDSDESNINMGVSSRRTRQQGKSGAGGCRFSGRSRRLILHHSASVALREVVKNGIRDPAKEQQHVFDVQMKCGSEPELCVCELDSLPPHSDREGCTELTEEITNDSTMQTQTMDIELHCQHDDSGLHASRSPTPNTPVPLTPEEGSSTQMLYSSSERSSCPCDIRSLYKRKLGFPPAQEVEVEQRKRQCVVNMEDEREGKHSEPC